MEIYNTMINIIGGSNISNYPKITSALFDTLQSNIDSYLLNTDRCNSCNVGCDVGCEVEVQCCDVYDCHECYSCGACDACDVAINCCVGPDSCIVGGLS